MPFKVQAACATLRPRFWPGIPRACGGPGLASIIESVSKSMTAGVRRSVVAAAVAAALVGGCASGDTGAAEVWDPIETPNRFIFSINRAVDMIAIRPLAVMYRDWVPEPRAEERAQPARQSRRAGHRHQRGLPGRSQPCRHDDGALPGELDPGRRRPVRRRHHARHEAHQGRMPARRSACGRARASSRRMAASTSCCRSPGRPMRATRPA